MAVHKLGEGNAVLPGTYRDEDDLLCPGCQDYLTMLATSYGFRATCRGCGVRWTYIHGDDAWYPEPYSGMADNLKT